MTSSDETHGRTASEPNRAVETSDADAFHLSVDLEVDLDGQPFFHREWRESIERRLV